MLARRALAVCLWLLLAPPALGAEPAGPEETPTAEGALVLHVRALIDGASQLNLWADRAQWRNREGNLPGAGDATHGPGPHPTYVNGQEWLPEWNGRTSEAYRLPFELPEDLSAPEVRVEKIAVRGKLTVKQTKMLLTVLLDDGPMAGADWYEFKVYIKPAEGPSTDGTAGRPPATATDGTGGSAGGKVALVASSNFIVQQAHYEATVAAAQQLDVERALVEEAWRTAATIQAEGQRLWQLGTEAQNRRDYWDAVAVDKRKEQDYWRRKGVDAGDVTWLSSTEYYYYNKFKREAEQAEAKRATAAGEVTNLKGQYDRAQAGFREAEADYWHRKNDYDAKFATLYAKEFSQRQAALTAKAREQQESDAQARVVQLKAETVTGTYTWLENGCELGQLIVAAKGAVTAPASEYGEAKGWKIGEDGLHLSFEKAEWVFVPGPANCLFGVCAGPGPEQKGKRAMLRPEKAPKKGAEVPEGAKEKGAGPAKPKDS